MQAWAVVLEMQLRLEDGTGLRSQVFPGLSTKIQSMLFILPSIPSQIYNSMWKAYKRTDGDNKILFKRETYLVGI